MKTGNKDILLKCTLLNKYKSLIIKTYLLIQYFPWSILSK